MADRRLIDRRAQPVEASKARPAERRSARIARFDLKFRDSKCLGSGDGFLPPLPRGLPRQSLPLAKAGAVSRGRAFAGMTASVKASRLAEMTSFPRSLCPRKRVAGIHFGQRIPKLELEDAVRHLDEAIPVQEDAHDASRLAGIAGPPIGRL